MPEARIWHPYQGAEAVFSTYPVVALCLPPANFSNRFAVKHTVHNYILHITMLAIDITREFNLSMNPTSITVAIARDRMTTLRAIGSPTPSF